MPESTTASGSASNHPTDWLGRVLRLQAPVTPDFGCCCCREPAVTERLALSALDVCGVAPPEWSAYLLSVDGERTSECGGVSSGLLSTVCKRYADHSVVGAASWSGRS